MDEAPEAGKSLAQPQAEDEAEVKPNPNEGYSAAETPVAPAGVDAAKEKKKTSLKSLDNPKAENTGSRVRFATETTVTSYAPSDSSEEWDPTADDDDEDDANAPAETIGLLWKKSPSAFIFNKYQLRYVRVKGGKIHWWKDREEFLRGPKRSRGQLDLKANRTEVVADGSVRFTLQPQGGSWTSGNFTGSASGRKFFMDTTDSEHSTSEWIRAIRAHIDYARTLAASAA